MLHMKYIFALVLIERFCIYCSKNNFCFNQVNLGYPENKRLNATIVFTSEMIGLSSCIKNCYRRGYCHYFNYNKLTHTCEYVVLNGSYYIGLQVVNNWTFGQVDDLVKSWVKDEYGIQSRCQFHEVMYILSNNKGTCLPQVKCPNPPAITNASLTSSNRSVGSTVSYKCGDNYYGVGNPFITCLENLSWSSTNFQCEGKWECVVYTQAEETDIAHGTRMGDEICQGHGGVFTRDVNNNVRYPGCETICWCCKRKILRKK